MRNLEPVLLQAPVWFEIEGRGDLRAWQLRDMSPAVPPASGNFQLCSKSPCIDPAWETQRGTESWGGLVGIILTEKWICLIIWRISGWLGLGGCQEWSLLLLPRAASQVGRADGDKTQGMFLISCSQVRFLFLGNTLVPYSLWAHCSMCIMKVWVFPLFGKWSSLLLEFLLLSPSRLSCSRDVVRWPVLAWQRAKTARYLFSSLALTHVRKAVELSGWRIRNLFTPHSWRPGQTDVQSPALLCMGPWSCTLRDDPLSPTEFLI